MIDSSTWLDTLECRLVQQEDEIERMVKRSQARDEENTALSEESLVCRGLGLRVVTENASELVIALSIDVNVRLQLAHGKVTSVRVARDGERAQSSSSSTCRWP